jgi:hypothetical protein
MPFDGAGFQPERPVPRPAAPSDNVVTLIIVAFALALLVMPVSVAAIVDIVAYFRTL